MMNFPASAAEMNTVASVAGRERFARFEPIPGTKDPRWVVLSLLTLYVTLGITVLNFNRTPMQVLTTIVSTCMLDIVLHFMLRRRAILFPLSAAISGAGLGILVNYAHGPWPIFIPIFFSIASKYVFTFEGRHTYNPTMFGVTASLLFGHGMISISPAYQWGGTLSVAAFIVTAALLFVFRINRAPLILSFLIFYAIQVSFRSWLTRFHLPPETLFLGALSSPAFYLFTFFMITDPATSPRSPRQQVLMAFCIVLFDLILHTKMMLSTLFFAGAIYCTLRLVLLHARQLYRTRGHHILNLVPFARNSFACGLVAMGGLAAFREFIHPIVQVRPGFKFHEISSSEAGISARPSSLLAQADPKAANIAKWLLSIGDAVAVADVNRDGLPDLFFTLPLKAAEDRAALYINEGNFSFKRVPIPALDSFVRSPTTLGMAAGALWFDYDNDGDEDLLISVGWGQTILLKNLLSETSLLQFEDVTRRMNLQEYSISIRAAAHDFDQDGLLDLIIANAMPVHLPDYSPPQVFNIFRLPEPAFPGDRRMLNFMHRTWYDAKNGGEKYFYRNTGQAFAKVDSQKSGLTGTRWSLDAGAGDLNGDGLPDLYFANDFGPDELFINRGNLKFERVQGHMVGDIGRDTYKGMNVSLADFDGNGFADIYVSNVHEKLQAEGSLLWMNSGKVDLEGFRAFTDEALARNALNERRFGWGAAVGDLNRDGKMDIVQSNGHLDDAYDKRYEPCEDFWYWNAQIGLTSPDIHGYADEWADIRGRCIFPNELNRVYLNQGGNFIDVASDVGIDVPGTARGVALVDLDNDGALDMVITHMFAPPSLYQMRAERRSWIGLDLEGDGITCNRDAVGTRVVIPESADGTVPRQLREQYAANGLSAQGDHRMLLGLGQQSGPTTVQIQWCGRGKTETISLAQNRYHKIQQTLFK